MKFEEVLPAFREGKKIKRKDWKSAYGKENFIENMSLYMSAILENDWEIVEEPKPPKMLAPALYKAVGMIWVSNKIYESEEAAQEDLRSNFISWPAVPNNGYYSAEEK